MDFLSNFGRWDLLLVLVVSIQATVITYLYDVKWKAFVLTLPIPFTIATLAVGEPINVCHVTGLILLLLFTNGVRLLYYRLKLPIIIAIIVPAVGYCSAGSFLAHILPKNQLAFWIAFVVTLVLAVVVRLGMSVKTEQGHRTSLPVWIKFPLVTMVVIFLIVIKHHLRGFMTVFPMVGVITAYEARHGLWTICRQIPVLMLTLLAMMISCNLSRQNLGTAGSLGVGWIVFLIMLFLLTCKWQQSVDNTVDWCRRLTTKSRCEKAEIT